jgi:hypothetical protein
LYTSIADLREEGVAETAASDARLEILIGLASRYIDRLTGRFFEPREMTVALDGTGGRVLRLGQPIVRVDGVFIGASPQAHDGVPLDPTLYRVYNRHLTQRFVLPDDRDDPRIEFVGDEEVVSGAGRLVWPRGAQNVTVQGVFGYTDPDGTPTGQTPDLIRHATKLLVMREMPRLADLDRREDAQRRWRITSERTRDQSYSLEALQLRGAFTGDPEIDVILAVYQRPPDLGAA